VADENWEERVEEWWGASRIDNGGNFGDVPVSFVLELTPGSGTCSIGNITWKDLPIIYEQVVGLSVFDKGITYYEKTTSRYVKTEDSSPNIGKKYYIIGKVFLNTKTGIVRGTDGELYNSYVSGDLTAKIPKNATAESVGDLEFTCLYI
jgi:hypothetical protein